VAVIYYTDEESGKYAVHFNAMVEDWLIEQVGGTNKRVKLTDDEFDCEERVLMCESGHAPFYTGVSSDMIEHIRNHHGEIFS